MEDINPDNWRVIRYILKDPPYDKGKVRFLLQHQRFDATRSYWLTYRVYRTSSQANLYMKKLLRGEKI